MGLSPSLPLITSSTLERQGLIANGSLGFIRACIPPFPFYPEADTFETNEKGTRAH
jgi:hypothetical protein